jgi:hypothetical protein
MKIAVPLVGMHFHPPAKAVVNAMQVGMSVTLIMEDDNQYDSNAVRVVYDMGDWPVDRMDALTFSLDAVYGGGVSASELCVQGLLFLGYLASSANKKATRGGPSNIEARLLASRHDGFDNLDCKFGLSVEGAPVIEIGEKE